MDKFIIVVLSFGGIFTFAFGMAWFLPLFAARTEEAEPPTKKDWVFGGADLILLLLDCFAIFWHFRAIPEIPSTYTAARNKWRQEPGVRGCFYAWLISLTVTVIAGFSW